MRNKKLKSRHAAAYKRTSRMFARGELWKLDQELLRRRGWVFEGDVWVDKKNFLVADNVQQAFDKAAAKKREVKQKELSNMSEYLLQKGWERVEHVIPVSYKKSESREFWRIPHWQKTVKANDPPYYVANLNKAWSLQMKMDAENEKRMAEKTQG